MPKRPSEPQRTQSEEKVHGLLGVGLDDDGGHRRVTRGEEFFLVGGSEETHDRMQGLVLRMHERLKRQGRRISDLNRTQLEDLARESM